MQTAAIGGWSITLVSSSYYSHSSHADPSIIIITYKQRIQNKFTTIKCDLPSQMESIKAKILLWFGRAG